MLKNEIQLNNEKEKEQKLEIVRQKNKAGLEAGISPINGFGISNYDKQEQLIQYKSHMKKEYGQIIAQSSKNSSPRPKGRKSNLNSRKGLEKSMTKNFTQVDGHKSHGNASNGEE